MGFLAHLRRTGAPLAVYGALVRTRLRGAGIHRRFDRRVDAFRTLARQGNFSTDWFTSRLIYWLDAFERHPLPANPEILEIGSWEGMSSLFILGTWPDAHLTCVDAWTDSAVHAMRFDMASVESRFDANLAAHADRLTKHKGFSSSYFQSGPARESFDLIYVDGSHQYADVRQDSFEGFDLLKPGGIMIFDDYLSSFGTDKMDSPAPAIHELLAARRGAYDIVSVYWQLIIRKRNP